MKKVKLLVIDPQVDFCVPGKPLFVAGALEDMTRVSKLIDRLGKKISAIQVTMDCHHLMDISHPLFYINSEGNHPDPYTQITKQDLISGKWRTTIPEFQQRAIDYEEALEKNNKYIHVIWPPHCLIGTEGNNIVSPLIESLLNWEESHSRIVTYVTKGSNIFTEHYSPYSADVPDPNDPSTHINMQSIQFLEDSDMLLLSGEALQFCVARGIRDLVENFGEESIKNIVFMEDCSSIVPNVLEEEVEKFINDMKGKGMQFIRSTDIVI